MEKSFDNIRSKLSAIQRYLKVPKGQYNNFGKYAYRNCEDILEALKPILETMKTALIISDEIVLIGERYYVKATATIMNNENEETISVSAYAREDDNKKGMDLSQLSGSTSSYARKYALNGLFAIDDTKDSDTTNTHGKEPVNEVKTQPKVFTISSNMATTLYELGTTKGLDKAKVDKGIKEYYKKNNANELTKKEYDDLVVRLTNIKVGE